MHLVLPFASTLAEGCVRTLRDLQLPNLGRLLARLAPAERIDGDETSLTPPHERALAATLGWHGADGCLPWAARLAAQDGIAAIDGHAWGLLVPTHWRVSADGVTLADPDALALTETESRGLLETLRPLFAERDGWRLHWGAPLRWYAAHESLRALPCASLDRAIGRAVDDWLAADARAARVRLLQSEAQMLLYHAPVNEAREARGALPVNSFWLHGCGAAQPAAAADDLQVGASLRAAALAEDWAAWAEAWRALDAGPIADLLRAGRAGDAAMLTLCGERSAQRFAPQAAAGLWSRLARSLRAPTPTVVLEAL